MTACEKSGNVAVCHAWMLQVSNSHPCCMFKSLSAKDSAVPWGENIKEEQQTNQTNKISLLQEAMVRSGRPGVGVLTVLSDFHGSHDKTGLGDRGKTKVGKVLKTADSNTGTAPGTYDAPEPRRHQRTSFHHCFLSFKGGTTEKFPKA